MRIKYRLFSNSAFVKNSAVLFAGTMLASVLNYLFHLMVGRQVSAEIYGETESLLSLINIISVPSMTLAMVATKYAASCSAEGDCASSREILAYLGRKVFKYGSPLFLAVVVATPFIGGVLNVRNNSALLMIWLVMLLSFFTSINTGILRGWQKFRDISLAGVWGALAKLVLGIILVRFGFALNGIVGSFLLGSLAAYLATLFALKFIRTKKREDVALRNENLVDLKSLKRYVIPVFAGNLAMAILGNADMVLAKRNFDALAAGQYGALTVVSKVIFFATGIIASVLFSMSAEKSHKGDSSHHIFAAALGFVFVASAVATSIYFAYPGLVLSILFGGKYQEITGYLGWFAIAVALYSISNVIFQYLLSLHKTRIAYEFLSVACLSVLAAFMYGRSIRSMLSIVIVSQMVAIIIGALHLLERKTLSDKKTVQDVATDGDNGI